MLLKSRLYLARMQLVAAFIILPLFAAHTSKNPRESVVTREFKKDRIISDLGSLLLSFEPNVGQSNKRVKFLARGNGYTLFLTSTEAVLKLGRFRGEPTHACDYGAHPADRMRNVFKNPQLATRDTRHKTTNAEPAVLRMSLIGANPSASIVGRQELQGKSNYFIGNNLLKWRTDIPNYARVICRSVYPGVDLVYRGKPRSLEYDFVVAPGADPAEKVPCDFTSHREGEPSIRFPTPFPSARTSHICSRLACVSILRIHPMPPPWRYSGMMLPVMSSHSMK